jgi:glutamate/tyrosine decarboxylase-like PLP-dependent enzyme
MLDLDLPTRAALWLRAGALLEEQLASLRTGPLVPPFKASAPAESDALRAAIAAFDFRTPVDPIVALETAVASLRTGQVHATDPRYFGLFHPAPAALAVVSAALVAAFDPQLATYGHAPWPVEIERHVVRALGERFGYAADDADGTFTTGGAEANTTALVTALAHAFPDVGRRGLRALDGDPTVYASTEAHPTIARAARVAGLGEAAVRVVPVDAHHRLKVDALRSQLAQDRRAGARPFLVVATAGTTSAGAIDELDAIADVAARAKCWLHVDAAWGGLAAFVPELRAALRGCARADSIAFDAHKALASPLGTGLLLTRHGDALGRALRPAHERGGYMPRGRDEKFGNAPDPYSRSLQWSRRFLGLGVFLTLAAAGFDGIAAALRTQCALADRLREGLGAAGFRVVNDTPLPLVCFVDATREAGDRAPHLESLARKVIARQAGWVSLVRFANGGRALRACVNNHRTEPRDVDRLLAALVEARGA